MRIEIEVEDELLEKAATMTGIEDTNQLVARGLETVIRVFSGGSVIRFTLLRGAANLEERRRRPH